MIDSSYVRIPEHRDDTVTLKPYVDFRDPELIETIERWDDKDDD